MIIYLQMNIYLNNKRQIIKTVRKIRDRYCVTTHTPTYNPGEPVLGEGVIQTTKLPSDIPQLPVIKESIYAASWRRLRNYINSFSILDIHSLEPGLPVIDRHYFNLSKTYHTTTN